MAGFSYLASEAVLNHLFRTSTLTKPTTWWIALFSVMPTESGGGTEILTVGTGYSRVSRAVADGQWFAAVSGSISNSSPVQFGILTANWGSVVGAGLYTASTAGDLWAFGTLTTPKTINLGDPPPSFPIGALTFRFLPTT